MKKVLLIPTYYYLSNPVYFSMKDLLKDDFEFTYFFTKDSTSIKNNLQNISKEKIGHLFDNYVELKYEAPWVKGLNNKSSMNNSNQYAELKNNYKRKFLNILRKFKKIFILIYEIKIYIKAFTDVIENISPDIIVITSDMTISYRIVKRYFPKINVIVLQPCFLDFRERELKIHSVQKRVVNYFLGSILYTTQPYFGMENEGDKLLLFEDKFLEFYKNKRKNVHKIVNPFYFKLNKDISSLKKPAVKEKLLKKINMNSNNDVIIIFLSDYTPIHGREVQVYLEDTYIKLINKYSSKYNFIIKNHPRAGVKNFEKNFINHENICFIKYELEYNEILALGDLNISINSNASLEAIVCGMPTINFLPLDLKENEHFKWLSYFGGVDVNSYEEMARQLDKFSVDKSYFIHKIEASRLKLIGNGEECKEKLLNIFNSS